MKIFCLVFILLLIISCNTYSEYAEYNKKGDDGMYVKIYNEHLKISLLTGGDFKYAFSQTEFKKLSRENPKFKNVLLYGITEHPSYEFYILINPKRNENYNGFIEKDTIIENNHYKIIISENAPKRDVNFIFSNLKTN